MKFSFLLNLNGILESVRPFHKIALGLTFISTLSLSTVVIQLIEPVKHVLFSLLITFPLTLGLIIVFLIFININWSKVSLLQVVTTPILISLLFAGLNAVSKHYKLEETGSQYEESQKKLNTDKPVEPQSTTNLKSSASIHTAPTNLQDRMREVSNGFQNSTESKPASKHNFFVNWLLLIVAGIVSLVNQFKEFYEFYKPVHFFSGIFMAIVFTYYIQINIINRFLIIKKEKADTLV